MSVVCIVVVALLHLGAVAKRRRSGEVDRDGEEQAP